MTPEQRLWQAVVHRAFLDATNDDPQTTENILAKREADTWISRCGKDFREVCSLAGMDADFLSEAYRTGRVRARLLRGMERG